MTLIGKENCSTGVTRGSAGPNPCAAEILGVLEGNHEPRR